MATHTDPNPSPPDSNTAAVIAGVLILPALITAIWVLHLPVVAAVGFTVMVPSLIGSTVAAITHRS